MLYPDGVLKLRVKSFINGSQKENRPRHLAFKAIPHH